MHRETWLRPAVLALAGLLLGACADSTRGRYECHVGAWRLADGRVMALTPSQGDSLRYRLMDGRSGRLYPLGAGRFESGEGWTSRKPVALEAEFGSCGSTKLRLQEARAAALSGARIPLERQDFLFSGPGIELAGRLVLPPGGTGTVVVLAHGSEKDSARRYYALQYFLPAAGIGVLVYDKRGTGGSSGSYTQDFHLLAQDLVAAVGEARRRVPDARIGLLGGSQGGWIAPLAATLVPVDFVIAAYGMAEGPLAEDREEVQRELRELGYGPEAQARARELTDATGRVMVSRHASGFEELAEVKSRLRDEPWIGQVRGEYTASLVRWPGWLLKIVGPFYDQGTSWEYEPVPVIKQVTSPMLWVLAGQDREAPSATTLEILRGLQPQPGRLDIAVFPTADHGIIEMSGKGSGRRLLRHSEGYFDLLVAWIRGEAGGRRFGNAEIELDDDG